MNKTDLIVAVQRDLLASKRVAARAVESVLGAITVGLHQDREVHVMGFGSFSVVTRAGRLGTNPQTRRPMRIPPTKVIKFKPGNDLKRALQ